jgi:MFS transporter, DHA1 family, tetracycline resistance protein
LKSRPLLLLFLIVFIDLMGFGIVIPLLPMYGERYHPSPVAFGLLMAVYSLMQFLFAPILGRLSDHYGRRPILVLSLAGTVAGYLLFAFQSSLAALFVSRIVAGITGANVATAQAVIADVTREEDRAKGMGLIGAAFGLGFILGPAIGGSAARFGEAAPGLFASGLSAAALILALVALPESNPPGAIRGHRAIRRGWLSPRSLMEALRHPQLGLLLVLFFLATFAFANFESTFALFSEKRLSLDMTHVAYLFVYVGLLAAVIQGALIGRLVKRFGERRLILAGALCLIPAYAAFSLLTSVPQILLFLGLLALGAGLTGPSLSSLISRLSKADEQGGVLGIGQSLSSLARIVGPFWGVYSLRAIGFYAPYLTAACAAAALAGLSLLVMRSARRPEVPALGLDAA